MFSRRFDMVREALCSLVGSALPLREECSLTDCLGEIQTRLDEYAGLKVAYSMQLSAKRARKMLKEGRDILAKLEDWIVRSDRTVTRDYVLNAMRSKSHRRRGTALLNRVAKEELARVRQWQEHLAQALIFIPSDRGSPEDAPLKQLVRDLAKIWDRYAAQPFSSSQKGPQPPAEFIVALCRLVEPDIKDARVRTAIRHAVKMTPGQRRGRKSLLPERD